MFSPKRTTTQDYSSLHPLHPLQPGIKTKKTKHCEKFGSPKLSGQAQGATCQWSAWHLQARWSVCATPPSNLSLPLGWALHQWPGTVADGTQLQIHGENRGEIWEMWANVVKNHGGVHHHFTDIDWSDWRRKPWFFSLIDQFWGLWSSMWWKDGTCQLIARGENIIGGYCGKPSGHLTQPKSPPLRGNWYTVWNICKCQFSSIFDSY